MKIMKSSIVYDKGAAIVRACYCGQHLASTGVVEVHLVVLLKGREVFPSCFDVEAGGHDGENGGSEVRW